MSFPDREAAAGGGIGESVITSITASLAAFVVATISTLGYLGVVGLMALESACVPIPSEVIMPFAGYLASTGRFNILLVAVAGAVGCNLGSTIAYAVGAYGGRPFVEKWGRYLLIGHSELDRVDRFFVKYGALAVFVGRLLPVIRTFISLPAGIARMPVWKFQLYSFAGSLPWCLALAYIGVVLGEAWDKTPWMHELMHGADIAVVVAIALLIAWHVWRSRRPSL
jgi:membrane protein DedA with SNARE-associated domain